MVGITIKGLSKVGRGFKNLETRHPFVGHRTIKKISTSLKISMKLRAPRWTGELRESIKIHPISKNKIEVSVGEGLARPYHIFWERGFRRHKVPTRGLYGMSMKRWMEEKLGYSSPYFTVGPRRKPFVQPAMERIKREIPKIAKREYDKFIRESFR